MPDTISVLFVCLGNICRSSLAEGVLRHKVCELNLEQEFRIDSAGTGGWHIGDPPDARARQAAGALGIDLSGQSARQLDASDFNRFDFILAMDRSNLSNIERALPSDGTARCELFLDFAGIGLKDVPDPYYGERQDFDTCLELILSSSDAILSRLIEMRDG